ncbi:hypothetical protein WJX81_001613 [Elliptochloris bilobata]|uniref:FAD-binding FR-type domain-containing protein n=1 Tax=Elliptochloris bilobata TaxID=381761 RepID=A0AAW1QWD4_9CHLO
MLVTPLAASQFHPYEKRMQLAAGLDPLEIEKLGERVIRSFMPEQHRRFFESLPWLLVGVQDSSGRSVAMALTGKPGFIQTPTATTMTIVPDQPLDPALFMAGRRLGFLGIEFASRRRNRLSTIVDSVAPAGKLQLRVLQSYGNCPKYIQIRHLRFHALGAASGLHSPAPVQTGPLGPEQVALVAAADTFFIATHFCSTEAGAASGSDVSHRGGPPGFVHVALDGATLRWADYIGNDMFNTLGNILSNGEAGLLFIDFTTGDTLRLIGRASIDLEDRSLPGAERVLAFRTADWAHERGALPLAATGPPEYSPYNPRSSAGAEQRRYAKLVRVADAAAGIKTFTFAWPEAAVRISRAEPFNYQPGMYASFDFQDIPGSSGALNRTWTISSHPDESAASGTFSISVKKAGVVSSYLHSVLKPGDAVEFRGALGDFVPVAGSGPALLIAGGIGITPMRAMLLEFAKQRRRAVLLYSVRAAAEAAFAGELQALADASGGAIRLVLTVTGPDPTWRGRCGRISSALIREQVPELREPGLTAYMCGPVPFMAGVQDDLAALCFDTAHLYQESFAF